MARSIIWKVLLGFLISILLLFLFLKTFHFYEQKGNDSHIFGLSESGTFTAVSLHSSMGVLLSSRSSAFSSSLPVARGRRKNTVSVSSSLSSKKKGAGSSSSLASIEVIHKKVQSSFSGKVSLNSAIRSANIHTNISLKNGEFFLSFKYSGTQSIWIKKKSSEATDSVKGIRSANGKVIYEKVSYTQ